MTNEVQLNMYALLLTTQALITEALEFVKQPLEVGKISGPIFGNIIETAFRAHLSHYDLPSAGKKTADFENVNVDLKTIQLGGRRGGAAKIHGYATSGSPSYSLLVIGYQYDGNTIQFEGVYFIPANEITWVQAEHYLFSLPDYKLFTYRVTQVDEID